MANDICECIKDWPSHGIKQGDLLEYVSWRWPCCTGMIKYPDTGWQPISDRKFKRYFKLE